MKTEVTRFRLLPEERQAFEAAAELSGLALSAWIRERLRRAARIELEDAGMQIPFVKMQKGS